MSYDSQEKQGKFVQRRKIQSTLLSDESSAVIDAFGLRNEDYKDSKKSYGVPHPIVFLINPEKQVAAKLYEKDYLSNDKSYRNRPEVDVILGAVDEAIAAGEL